jgi:hypothetical protein
MKDTPTLLYFARARLRRVEARLLRYPHDDRLRRLRREAHFRVTELEALLEERGVSRWTAVADASPSTTPLSRAQTVP